MLIVLNVKKWLSSLIRIKATRIMIDHHHAFDLKSLNSNQNQIFVWLLNHHPTIRWTSFNATTAINRNTSLATVVNLEDRWILITSSRDSKKRIESEKSRIEIEKRIISVTVAAKINEMKIMKIDVCNFEDILFNDKLIIVNCI